MNQEVCHWTAFPNVTCIDALRQNVGFVNTTITWKRIKWNNELAEKYKYGEQTSETADLSGVVENTLDSVNIGFKFFDETSCALGEGGSSGRKGCNQYLEMQFLNSIHVIFIIIFNIMKIICLVI